MNKRKAETYKTKTYRVDVDETKSYAFTYKYKTFFREWDHNSSLH